MTVEDKNLRGLPKKTFFDRKVSMTRNLFCVRGVQTEPNRDDDSLTKSGCWQHNRALSSCLCPCERRQTSATRTPRVGGPAPGVSRRTCERRVRGTCVGVLATAVAHVGVCLQRTRNHFEDRVCCVPKATRLEFRQLRNEC